MKRITILFAFLAFSACQTIEHSGPIESPESIQYLTRVEEQGALSYDSVHYFSGNDFSTWTNITNLEERFSACNVSLEKAKSMTTDAIVRSILHYPLNHLIFAYNDPLDAVELVLKYSILHQELLRRSDAAETVLHYFGETEIDMTMTKANGNEYDTQIGYSDEIFLEYLIASGSIKGFDNPSISKKLIAIVDNKVKERCLDAETFSDFSILPLNAIKNSFSSTQMQRSSTYIYTYFGQALGVEMYSEFSQSEIENINYDFILHYPNAEFIGPASRTYNCHSYAWYNQSTNNHYWLNSLTQNNTFQLQRYWTDDYYYATTESDAEKVFYSSGDHSAIPLSTTSYISKWGQGPLMKHSPTYCPYISSNRHYYKHRTSLPYLISSSIVGENIIPANTSYEYNLPQYYADLTINWSAEPFPGISGTCQVMMNSDQSCSFSASANGAYYLYVDGYRNGIQMIDGYMIIAVYED